MANTDSAGFELNKPTKPNINRIKFSAPNSTGLGSVHSRVLCAFSAVIGIVLGLCRESFEASTVECIP